MAKPCGRFVVFNVFGTVLSLLVCTADVCSRKGTLLYTCVSASVGRKVSILLVFLQGPVIINALVFTQFKISLQFELICWDFLPVSALTLWPWKWTYGHLNSGTSFM